jgi:hypothetical protein
VPFATPTLVRVTMPCHTFHEAIAAKFVSFTWINGTIIPADIVSKYWLYPQFLKVQAIPFYSGDTSEFVKEDKMILMTMVMTDLKQATKLK